MRPLERVKSVTIERRSLWRVRSMTIPWIFSVIADFFFQIYLLWVFSPQGSLRGKQCEDNENLEDSKFLLKFLKPD